MLSQRSDYLEELREWVGAYASLGWRVLPARGKKYHEGLGPARASSELPRCLDYFNKPCNVGVATGSGSGIVVVDIDPRNGGDLSFRRLERNLGPLPPTVEARTGGGGRHLVFQHFAGARSQTPESGIDFLADGKMFIAAPSVHPESGRPYTWEVSPLEAGAAPLPPAWSNLLGGQADVPTTGVAGAGPVMEGSRNDYLTRKAGELRAQGESGRSIEVRLLEENHLHCNPPLSVEEVHQIVKSVERYAPGTGASLKTRWQDAVLDSSMTSNQKVILLALASFADEHGRTCWPNQEQIAWRASCTSRTVRKYLQEAKKDGLITVYSMPRKTGCGYSNGYILTLNDR